MILIIWTSIILAEEFAERSSCSSSIRLKDRVSTFLRAYNFYFVQVLLRAAVCTESLSLSSKMSNKGVPVAYERILGFNIQLLRAAASLQMKTAIQTMPDMWMPALGELHSGGSTVL